MKRLRRRYSPLAPALSLSADRRSETGRRATPCRSRPTAVPTSPHHRGTARPEAAGRARTQRRTARLFRGARGRPLRPPARIKAIMDHFQLRNGELYAEDVPLARIAGEVGTPVYVYSRATLERHARVFREAPRHRRRACMSPSRSNPTPTSRCSRCCSVKATARTWSRAANWPAPCAAGWRPRTSCSPASARPRANWSAGLDAEIGQFNIESEEEGRELAAIAAARGLVARCALRVNPDIDAGTHAKISTGKKDNKFGVPIDEAPGIYARLSRIARPRSARRRAAHRQPACRPDSAGEGVRQPRRTDRRSARCRAQGDPCRSRRRPRRALQGGRSAAEPGGIRRDGRAGDAGLGRAP